MSQSEEASERVRSVLTRQARQTYASVESELNGVGAVHTAPRVSVRAQPGAHLRRVLNALVCRQHQREHRVALVSRQL